jgi:hypothetical protein
MSKRYYLFAAAVFAAALPCTAMADSGAAAQSPPLVAPVPVSDAELAGWIADLQSDNFKARRTAMRQLLDAGAAAVGPVAQAAETDDLELASRCIDILKVMQQSENVAAKLVADAALTRLARSERASVAQRAAEAVKKPEPVDDNRFGAVQIQLQVGPAGGIRIGRGARRQLQRENVVLRQTVNNGQRTTEVETGGRKIHISDSQGKDIVVKVTGQVDGKEKTTEHKAKDLDELKKNHPEAARLYEQYALGQNNIGVGANGGAIVVGQIQINGQAQAIPIQVPGIRIAPAGGNDEQHTAARKQLQAAQEQLSGTLKQLKELAAQGDIKPEQLQTAARQIEAAIEQLQQAQKRLDR